MELGNLSDLIANVSLAWLSALCLFWAFTFLIIGGNGGRGSIVMLGSSMILTSFYFGVIALSTGVMTGEGSPFLIAVARFDLLIDMTVKTILTGYFICRRRKSRGCGQ